MIQKVRMLYSLSTKLYNKVNSLEYCGNIFYLKSPVGFRFIELVVCQQVSKFDTKSKSVSNRPPECHVQISLSPAE